MNARRILPVAVLGAVVGAVGAVVLRALVHTASGTSVRYDGTYAPLQSNGATGSAYSSTLTTTFDGPQRDVHPSWAIVLPVGIAAGIILAVAVLLLVERLRRRAG